MQWFFTVLSGKLYTVGAFPIKPVQSLPDSLVPDAPFMDALLFKPDAVQTQFLEELYIFHIALIQGGDIVLGAAADILPGIWGPGNRP